MNGASALPHCFACPFFSVILVSAMISSLGQDNLGTPLETATVEHHYEH